MILRIRCLLLKVTRFEVGSAEVISTCNIFYRELAFALAVLLIKFGVIEVGRHSCALVMVYH